MVDIKSLPNIQDDSIKNILKKTAEAEYEELFIIGMKDGSFYRHRSGFFDLFRSLGALEVLKEYILSECEARDI